MKVSLLRPADKLYTSGGVQNSHHLRHKEHLLDLSPKSLLISFCYVNTTTSNLLLSSSLTNVIIMGLIGFLCELVVLGFMAAGIASNAAVVGSKLY